MLCLFKRDRACQLLSIVALTFITFLHFSYLYSGKEDDLIAAFEQAIDQYNTVIDIEPIRAQFRNTIEYEVALETYNKKLSAAETKLISATQEYIEFLQKAGRTQEARQIEDDTFDIEYVDEPVALPITIPLTPTQQPVPIPISLPLTPTQTTQPTTPVPIPISLPLTPTQPSISSPSPYVYKQAQQKPSNITDKPSVLTSPVTTVPSMPIATSTVPQQPSIQTTPTAPTPSLTSSQQIPEKKTVTEQQKTQIKKPTPAKIELPSYGYYRYVPKQTIPAKPSKIIETPKAIIPSIPTQPSPPKPITQPQTSTNPVISPSPTTSPATTLPAIQPQTTPRIRKKAKKPVVVISSYGYFRYKKKQSPMPQLSKSKPQKQLTPETQAPLQPSTPITTTPVQPVAPLPATLPQQALPPSVQTTQKPQQQKAPKPIIRLPRGYYRYSKPVPLPLSKHHKDKTKSNSPENAKP